MKIGYHNDVWRGPGWFVSWVSEGEITNRHFTLCFRPFYWRLASRVTVKAKPGYERSYFGPFEFERSNQWKRMNS